jgi:hypothetical protein
VINLADGLDISVQNDATVSNTQMHWHDGILKIPPPHELARGVVDVIAEQDAINAFTGNVCDSGLLNFGERAENN